MLRRRLLLSEGRAVWPCGEYKWPHLAAWEDAELRGSNFRLYGRTLRARSERHITLICSLLTNNKNFPTSGPPPHTRCAPPINDGCRQGTSASIMEGLQTNNPLGGVGGERSPFRDQLSDRFSEVPHKIETNRRQSSIQNDTI